MRNSRNIQNYVIKLINPFSTRPKAPKIPGDIFTLVYSNLYKKISTHPIVLKLCSFFYDIFVCKKTYLVSGNSGVLASFKQMLHRKYKISIESQTFNLDRKG